MAVDSQSPTEQAELLAGATIAENSAGHNRRPLSRTGICDGILWFTVKFFQIALRDFASFFVSIAEPVKPLSPHARIVRFVIQRLASSAHSTKVLQSKDCVRPAIFTGLRANFLNYLFNQNCPCYIRDEYRCRAIIRRYPPFLAGARV